MASNILLFAVLPVATTIVWETLRRFCARRMSLARFAIRCPSPVGDQWGHRKLNVEVHLEGLPWWARWLLDARAGGIDDATIQGRVYNSFGVDDWERTFDLEVFDFLWSSNLPDDTASIQSLIRDASRLRRAQRARITPQDSGVAAVVLKELGQRYPFVILPQTYRNGLPGQGGIGHDLLLDQHVLVLKIAHSDDPNGKQFYLLITNTGHNLQDLTIEKMSARESKRFRQRIGKNF